MYIIAESEAEDIARNFLQQHHSILSVGNVIEKEGHWIVEVSVSSPKPAKFQIKISSKTGHIMEFIRIDN